MVNDRIHLMREIIGVLRAGQIEDAELEAKWVLEDAATAEQAREIARRRAAREPLQYLLGTWEFYGLTMQVGKGVLVPRADTETLVDAVLERLRGIPAPSVVDLCTGSGCIALALQSVLPQAEICGIEVSEIALQYALKNAAYHKMPTAFLHGDVLDEQTAAQFHDLDCIVSNPPYLTAEDMLNLQQEVRHEPAIALAGGPDGLRFYPEITRLWRDALKSGGILAFEVGIRQAEDVAAILTENGFTDVEAVRDLNGIERVVIGKKEQI